MDVIQLAREMDKPDRLEAVNSSNPSEEDLPFTAVVELDIEVESWQEAVRATGRLLVDNGAAEERYIEAMVEMVRDIGPYIVLAPGIAMPHASPDSGALKVAVAVTRLEKPVEFGSKFNDPVDIIIAFCTPDPTTHVSLLRRIALILGDQDYTAQLWVAEAPKIFTIYSFKSENKAYYTIKETRNVHHCSLWPRYGNCPNLASDP